MTIISNISQVIHIWNYFSNLYTNIEPLIIIIHNIKLLKKVKNIIRIFLSMLSRANFSKNEERTSVKKSNEEKKKKGGGGDQTKFLDPTISLLLCYIRNYIKVKNEKQNVLIMNAC